MMDKFDMYVTLIFIVKIMFILLAVAHIYLNTKGKSKSTLDKKIVYWKDRLEFVFVALMSVLLIYLFNPRASKPVVIDKETKVLLFLFGFVLIITAKWSIFFTDSIWAKKVKKDNKGAN